MHSSPLRLQIVGTGMRLMVEKRTRRLYESDGISFRCDCGASAFGVQRLANGDALFNWSGRSICDGMLRSFAFRVKSLYGGSFVLEQLFVAATLQLRPHVNIREGTPCLR